MNKLVKFKSILFSSAIFLLTPILGMDNDPVLTKSKSQKKHPREFIWTSCIDSVDKYDGDNDNSSSSSSNPSNTSNMDDFSTIIANDPTNILPDEILLRIFREVLFSASYIKDFNNIACVNENWYRIWQDHTLQEARLRKISRSSLFRKEIETFKQTHNPKDLNLISKQLEKDDYNNTTIIQLLSENNIEIKDVIPNFDNFNIVKKFAILIKFKDKNGIKQFTEFCKKNMGVGWLATTLNTRVDSHGRTLPLCAISFIDCTDTLTNLIHFFVGCGADLRIPNFYGCNALHYAVQKGSVKLLCALLLELIINSTQQHVAMLSFKNRANETPKELAIKLFKEIKHKTKATKKIHKKPTREQMNELTKRKKILCWISRAVNPNDNKLIEDLEDYINSTG